MSSLNLQVVSYNPATLDPYLSRHQIQDLKNEKPLIKTQWILRDDTPQSIAYLKHVFRASRNIESDDLKKIVQLIHDCKAHELFDKIAPPYKIQPNSKTIGEGRHQFLSLQECSCSVLDRLTKPGIRIEYEKQVLDKIDVLAQVMTVIPISIFAPGMLFGEFVLLVKILKLLEKKNWHGELKLFFIDKEYASGQAYTLLKSQKKSGKRNIDQISLNYNKAVKIPLDIQNVYMQQLDKIYNNSDDEASKAIQDFFDLLQKITIPSIKINSFFFNNVEHYIELAEHKPKFKNVLQIGSDIGDNRLTVINLVKKTQSENGMGIVVLVPRPVLDQTGVQEITSDGLNKVQPMIFFMETQADEVQYKWLNNPDM